MSLSLEFNSWGFGAWALDRDLDSGLSIFSEYYYPGPRIVTPRHYPPVRPLLWAAHFHSHNSDLSDIQEYTNCFSICWVSRNIADNISTKSNNFTFVSVCMFSWESLISELWQLRNRYWTLDYNISGQRFSLIRFSNCLTKTTQGSSPSGYFELWKSS